MLINLGTNGLKSSTSYINTLNTLPDNEEENYEENERKFSKQTYIDIYITEEDRRDEPDTATPIVGKQHIIL